MGAVVLPVMGAFGGFMVGGGLGAIGGAMLGSALGRGGSGTSHSVFSSNTKEYQTVQVPAKYGPRLTDLRIQYSSYGEVIPKLYGTMRTAGNVIWCNPIKEVVNCHVSYTQSQHTYTQTHTETDSGKGGVIGIRIQMGILVVGNRD